MSRPTDPLWIDPSTIPHAKDLAERTSAAYTQRIVNAILQQRTEALDQIKDAAARGASQVLVKYKYDDSGFIRVLREKGLRVSSGDDYRYGMICVSW